MENDNSSHHEPQHESHPEHVPAHEQATVHEHTPVHEHATASHEASVHKDGFKISKNSIILEFKNAIEILKMNKAKIKEVQGNPASTKWGIFFIALPVVVNLVVYSLTFPSGLGVIFAPYVFWSILIPALSLVGMMFGVGIFMQKFFKVPVKLIEIFRVLSYVSVLLWISMVGFLLSLVSLFSSFGSSSFLNLIVIITIAWMMYVFYNLLLEEHKLNSQNAGITVAVGVVIYFLLGSILGNILIGSHFSMFF